MASLHQHARRFLHNRRGGAAITFGLAAIPTFAFIGFAMDYGVALATKAKLDAAADSASMVAINTAKTVIQGAPAGTDPTASAIQQGQTQAAQSFNANAGALAYTTLPVPVVNLTRTNQTLTAAVSYSTVVKNNFSGMIGFKQSNMSGKSTSTLTMPTYINYYIILDNSQSMGVGSTQTDMTNLYNRVIQYKNYQTVSDKNNNIGCVFGCHVKTNDTSVSPTYTQPYTNEDLAHNSNYGSFINLRIDAAKCAIQNIVTLAQQANNKAGLPLVKIGIYTMQQDPTTNPPAYMTTVIAPSSNLNSSVNASTTGCTTISTDTSSVSYKTNNVDLGNNNANGIGDSSLLQSLETFNSNTLTQSNGNGSANSPLQYVFIITDGMQDIPNVPWPNSDYTKCTDNWHCMKTIDFTNGCQPLWSKSTVGVIYTTYNPIYQQNNPSFKSQDPKSPYVDAYYDLVLPFASQIAPALTSCATSSQWYFEAIDGPSITTGMQQLFAPTLQAARVSQ